MPSPRFARHEKNIATAIYFPVESRRSIVWLTCAKKKSTRGGAADDVTNNMLAKLKTALLIFIITRYVESRTPKWIRREGFPGFPSSRPQKQGSRLQPLAKPSALRSLKTLIVWKDDTQSPFPLVFGGKKDGRMLLPLFLTSGGGDSMETYFPPAVCLPSKNHELCVITVLRLVDGSMEPPDESRIRMSVCVNNNNMMCITHTHTHTHTHSY